MAGSSLGGRTAALRSRFAAQVETRRVNDAAVIENPLSHMSDEELVEDVREFARKQLPFVPFEDVLRAARVAKDVRLYDEVARRRLGAGSQLAVQLTPEERKAITRERDFAFSERGMWIIIATVSLAALLQGFVQSSFNGSSIYYREWSLDPDEHDNVRGSDWRLGAANASPWFSAAIVGCPLSLPINYWLGRRGGIGVGAFLIFASSVSATFAVTWSELVTIRIFNGIGMGIKAVSTTILVSETAVGFWRGSAVLVWQLWVAFGIMAGFALNMIFTRASTDSTTVSLILGAPMVPGFALFVMAIFFCPESPRYYLMRGPNHSVETAYRVLQRVRNTELQALRDLYVVYKAVEQEHVGMGDLDENANRSPGFFWVMRDFLLQFTQLFQQRRLYNAAISSSTVNLVQQLCGVNVPAFYSGTLLSRVGSSQPTIVTMAYSLGFGAINFLFGLPAIRSIDTIGRRKLLITTLPFMAVFMLGAGLSAFIDDEERRIGVTACFLFLFAIAYSPGLGPIPFTLASESFPLSHREAGTAWAISINLFFAGLLAILFPRINSTLGQEGSLGLFAGLNVVALVLVFLLVEETKRRSLEDLDHIFAVSKREFMRFQVFEYLPWAVNRYLLGRRKPRPEMYRDMIWGSMDGDGIARIADELDGTETARTVSERYPSTIGTPVHIALAMVPSSQDLAAAYRNPNAVEIGDSRPPVSPPPVSPLSQLASLRSPPTSPLSPLGSHPSRFE